jgi:hypothetical protein
MMLPMSALDMRTTSPAVKQGTRARLCLADMSRNSSLTTSGRVDRDRLEIKAFRGVCLASLITRQALHGSVWKTSDCPTCGGLGAVLKLAAGSE